MENNNNNLIQKDIQETLSTAFLNYAGYNLQRRAIPDARDGLKWGARQLLHAQYLGGFTYDKPFKKAIKSVSQAMGFSYVHGDASAYGTFVRMAKPFSYRYPLQEAKGNYGTLINPDDHSASRYLELRGSKLASLLLEDINKDTIVDWEDTYDLEGQFPKVLPSKGFYGMVNGCISIGSGMSCSIPPLNLKEVNEALIKLIQNPNIDIDEILCYPDFPTGATILNKEEVKESMIKGYGHACKIRSSIEYDPKENCFIVKEMPYSTFTNTICNELATLIETEPDCGIKDFADYTKRTPDLRIYLTKGATPNKVLKYLYKNTSLQTHYTINMIMLDKGTTPKVFGLREAFQAHIDHEKDVYRRGFEFDLNKINSRLHIIDGMLKAINAIDEVIKLIKSSKDLDTASKELQKFLDIDAIQAKAILDIKLAKLAHLEIDKLVAEQKNLLSQKQHIETILNSEELFNKELINGWRETAEKFGDARRTQILNVESEDDEPVETKQISLAFTNKGGIFCSEVSSLYSQKRAGVGAKFKLENGEFIVDNLVGQNIDKVLFFTNKGNYYGMSMGSFVSTDKLYLSNFFSTFGDETIQTATVIAKEKKPYIVFVTKNGIIKKSKLDEYNLKRNGGAQAIKLDEGDEIVSTFMIDNDDVGIMSKCGQFIRVKTDSINAIGRVTRGIMGMKLVEGDYVVAARPITSATKEIMSIAADGYGKRTNINEFSVTGTNTKGVKIQKSDNMCDFIPLINNEDLLVVSSSSQIRLKQSEVPLLTRGTQGTKIIKLAANSQVIRISQI